MSDYNAIEPDESIVRKQVDSITFSYYTDDDVRQRSVVQVTSPISFDPNGNPLQTGLYDPRMGPYNVNDKSPCPTCSSNRSYNCNGHFGHIELLVPVYHPIRFPELVQALKCKCLFCHSIQGPKQQLDIIQCKLLLVLTNQYPIAVSKVDALIKVAIENATTTTLSNNTDMNQDDDDDVDENNTTGTPKTRSNNKKKPKPTMTQERSMKAARARAITRAIDQTIQRIYEQYIDPVRRQHHPQQQQQQQQQPTTTTNWTAQSKAYYTTLVKEAIGMCSISTSKRCYHCQLYNPKIRHDQSNKIFQMKLSKRLYKFNQLSESSYFRTVPIPALTVLEKQQQQHRMTGTTATSSDNNNNNQSQRSSDNNDNDGGGGGGYNSDATEDIMRHATTSRSNSTSGLFVDEEAVEDTNDMDDDIDDDDDDDDDNNNNVTTKQQQQARDDQYMHPSEVQAQLKLMYAKHPILCNCLFGTIRTNDTTTTTTTTTTIGGTNNNNNTILIEYSNPHSYQIYFMTCIAVPPNRFRPPMIVGTMVAQHSQTESLATILKQNAIIQESLSNQLEERMYRTWIELQTTINVYFDNSKHPNPYLKPSNGIRQLLEKKHGLFRMNMMGKRVNYCCRSVISPDPNIGTNEIGIPQQFAKTLTYPTPVTKYNVHELRQAVIRGTDHYPGARYVEIYNTNNNTMKRIELSRMKKHQRESVAATLVSHLYRSNNGTTSAGKPTIVGRQLRDGDYVLMNRQPTLHKPGIMAHQVRVLYNPTQKTIRMHYANCNTYNADFDGDEMNCHVCQNDIGRSESQYIMNTNEQYIVPTDGTPIRGLIQDHVVGGVLLTKTDTFLQKYQYIQLVFASLTSLNGLEIISNSDSIDLIPPAIYKPRQLWTGKQVITTLLYHLRKQQSSSTSTSLWYNNNTKTATSSSSNTNTNTAKDDSSSFLLLPGLTVTTIKTKTPDVAFGIERKENIVIIQNGELLCGVLDKNSFGTTNFSLIHSIYEIYGSIKAGYLLNSFGKLFTAYIQYYYGHSCRIEDLCLTNDTTNKRQQLIQQAYIKGTRAAQAWAYSDGGKVPIVLKDKEEQNTDQQPLQAHEIIETASKIGMLLTDRNEGKTNFQNFDSYMQSQLNPLSSSIVKECLPNGLKVLFPNNTFSRMTITGAKGSIVNQSQVSCALGQQALEGRRVPRMSSGKTLPSFQPYDPNPRSDGYVLDCFLTGIRPQEYYFHCMAGREGLVDTAVKTSRSGYLQRCIIKHLEDIKVCYDYTVRNSENNIIQFLYGEDGLDPTKASYFDTNTTTSNSSSSKATSFEFMVQNSHSLLQRNQALPHSTIEVAYNHAKRYQQIIDDYNDNDNSISTMLFHVGDYVMARRLRFGTMWNVRGALCTGWYPAIVTKVVVHQPNQNQTMTTTTVNLRYIVDDMEIEHVPIEVRFDHTCGTRYTKALSNTTTLVIPAAPDPIISSSSVSSSEFNNNTTTSTSTSIRHKLGSSGACVSERIATAAYKALETSISMQQLLQKQTQQTNNTTTTTITMEYYNKLIASKYSTSLCVPGEAVGCIAGQSIGEPSTQMTLNTFHLAGSGANVTLGIPRLREIIQTASKTLKTPTMSVPLLSFVNDKNAIQLANQFQRLTLYELLSCHRGVTVVEKIECCTDSGSSQQQQWLRSYYITLTFHPIERIYNAFGIRMDDIVSVVTNEFVTYLTTIIKKEIRRSIVESNEERNGTATATATNVFSSSTASGMKGRKKRNDDEDDDDFDDFNENANDGPNDDNDNEMLQDSDRNNKKKKGGKNNNNNVGMKAGNDNNDGDDDDDDDDDNDDDDAGGEEDGMDTTRQKERREGVSYDDEGEEEEDDDDDDDSNDNDAEQEPEESVGVNDVNNRQNNNKKKNTNNNNNNTNMTKDMDNTITLEPFRIDPSTRPLLMVGLVEAAAEKILVRSRKNIKQAYINDEGSNRGRCLQIAGINFEELWKLERIDHNRIMSNDTWAICQAYGIEAGRNNIVKQIQDVFGAYGIDVNVRHLSLVADYMTYEGGYKALNRIGMESSGSTLLQMSFETTTTFLKKAATLGVSDMLHSPSSNIVVGRPMKHGTGCFHVLAQYNAT